LAKRLTDVVDLMVLSCGFQPKLMRSWIRIFILSLACFASIDAAKRPNIVLIMADEMGFAGLGCYGSKIQTPNVVTLLPKCCGLHCGLRFVEAKR